MKKKNRTPTPHDAAFRQFLTQPDVARDFMLIHLPPDLRAVCDLSTLKLESGSFVEDDLLAARLYGKAFPLVDVTVIPDEEIAGHRTMAALTLLQKHIHRRDLAEMMDKLASILLAGYLSSSQLISLVHYILQAGETSDARAFVRELAQRMPQQGDELMTIAEQLEQNGVEKGIQLGRQEGRQEGRNEGKLEVARRLLEMGMPRESVQQATGLSEADLAQICH